MHEALWERFRRGDRLALARLLTLAAHGEDLEPTLTALTGPPKPARVVAVTGSAGVGKSTLVGVLLGHIRSLGLKVAVLACDPQSPLSGGALLGDRFRMPSDAADEGVFIRSLAAPGGHGAVADHVSVLIALLEAFGFDVVLLETVGAGQGDTVVQDLADVVVLLLQPETGDDLQWEKAGVLEVADVVAVHKADLPGMLWVESQVRAALQLSEGHPGRVVCVSSRTGEGVDALWDAVRSLPLRRRRRGLAGRDLLVLAQELLASRFAEAVALAEPQVRDLVGRWQEGQLGARAAGHRLLELLAERHVP